MTRNMGRKKTASVRCQPPRLQEATRQQEAQGVTETPGSQEMTDTPRRQVQTTTSTPSSSQETCRPILTHL